MPTQADIDRLEAALARGELRVRAADGSEITYRSVAEMITAISYMKGGVNSAPMIRTTYTSFARS